MKAFLYPGPRTVIALLAFAILTVGARPADAPPVLSAKDLASRMSAAMEDGSSFIRVKLEKGPPKETLQLQIKQRRTKSSTEVIYQVLWPKERKGESVLLRKTGSRPATGALFTPPNIARTLDASDMKEPLFGSDLTYEDVVDNFFAWEQQTIVGTEDVDGVACQILESKPTKAGNSSYGSVRSWIDARRLVPLRVEKYSTAGQSLRRIDSSRVVSVDGRQTPANLTIRRTGQPTATTMDGSKIKRDVIYTDSEFTPEGIREVTTPRSAPE
jgi:outer membrane lipoprotein-sorting protein